MISFSYEVFWSDKIITCITNWRNINLTLKLKFTHRLKFVYKETNADVADHTDIQIKDATKNVHRVP